MVRCQAVVIAQTPAQASVRFGQGATAVSLPWLSPLAARRRLTLAKWLPGGPAPSPLIPAPGAVGCDGVRER